MAATATSLKDLAEPRRTATLVAVVRHLGAVAVDDALDLFAQLMTTRVINPARKVADQRRSDSLPELQQAAKTLAMVTAEVRRRVTDAGPAGMLDVAEISAALDAIAAPDDIDAAVRTVDRLVHAEDPSMEAATRVAVADRYRTVRPFVALLAESPVLCSTPGDAAKPRSAD